MPFVNEPPDTLYTRFVTLCTIWVRLSPPAMMNMEPMMMAELFEKTERADSGLRHPVMVRATMDVMDTRGSGNLFDI